MSLTERKQNPKCPDVRRGHGSRWAGWGLFGSSPLLEIGHHPTDCVPHEHSVLQTPPGASRLLHLLSAEQAPPSDLREKQDCSTPCTQDKPHRAAPPRAHLETGDFPGQWLSRLTSDSAVNKPPANVGDSGSILGPEEPLEDERTTHSSILAWKIAWTEEPGRVTVHGVTESQTPLSMPAHTREHTHTHTHTHTPLGLPGLITGPLLWVSTFSTGVQGEASGMYEPNWEKIPWVHILNGLCSLKIMQGQKEGKSIF